MKKTIIDAMKHTALQSITSRPSILIGLSQSETVDKDTGEVSEIVKVDAEVPKGISGFSRCRFSVKILGNKIAVSDNDLEKYDFFVTFKNLEISYIDERGTVYFRAEDYIVKKEVQ